MRHQDYVLRRSLFALATVFMVLTINFFLFRVMPGSSAANLARVPHSSPQLRHALVVEFGLDKPKWEQYLTYLGALAHGNLGISFANQQPVISNLRTDLADTVPVVSIGTVIALALGIATGALSAWRRGSLTDHVSTNLAIAFYAFPTQWIGLMLLLAFANYLPTAGMSNAFVFSNPPFWQHLLDIARHMILPVATLVLTLYGGNTLIVRSAMLETLGEDYILTARAKGLRSGVIMRRHSLRNAMLPIATLIALSLGYIVAGSVLIEVVFSWPGIGLALYDAVANRDFPMLQGCFLVLTLSIVLFNFLADLVYPRLDPRVAE